MRFARTVRSALALVPLLALAATAVAQTSPVLVIHGGAGTAPTPPMAPERSAAYEAGLRRALDAGWAVLDGGGAALDAVEAAIRVLEDDSLFNAGVGAVFTHEGRNELDASLMDGATGKAGAVAGVTRIANPISLARLVMDRSPHVLLTGDGAEEFALGQGVALVPRGHFFTGGRWRDLQQTLERERAVPPAGARGPVSDRPVGTVGAVALDRAGRLAAGTSTGGMNNKRWGRVGDSPIIGAGTWADDRCAVSATGHGEFFIRNAVAHDICARVRYLEIPLVDAADQVVMDVLVAKGGEGGVIALGADGAVAMPFNSGAMFRAFRAEGREPVIGFLRE